MPAMPDGLRSRSGRAHGGGSWEGARQRTLDWRRARELGPVLRRGDRARSAHGARLPRAARRAVPAPPDGLVDVSDGRLLDAGARPVRLAARRDAMAPYPPAAVAPRPA